MSDTTYTHTGDSPVDPREWFENIERLIKEKDKPLAWGGLPVFLSPLMQPNQWALVVGTNVYKKLLDESTHGVNAKEPHDAR